MRRRLSLEDSSSRAFGDTFSPRGRRGSQHTFALPNAIALLFLLLK
jgi:hypothetical protein